MYAGVTEATNNTPETKRKKGTEAKILGRQCVVKLFFHKYTLKCSSYYNSYRFMFWNIVI